MSNSKSQDEDKDPFVVAPGGPPPPKVDPLLLPADAKRRRKNVRGGAVQ